MFVLLPTIFLQYRYYGTVDRHNSLVDDSTGQYCLVLVHPCQIEVLLHLRHPNASSSLHWAQFGLHVFKCWISVLKISVEKKLLRAFRKAYFLVLLFNKRTVLEGIRIVFLQLFLQACTKIPILPDYNRHVDYFSSGIKRRKKNNLKK